MAKRLSTRRPVNNKPEITTPSFNHQRLSQTRGRIGNIVAGQMANHISVRHAFEIGGNIGERKVDKVCIEARAKTTLILQRFEDVGTQQVNHEKQQ